MAETVQTSDTRHCPMTLGTVQLGLPYGIANRIGQPDEAEAIRLVQLAIRSGITHLDCAQAYGTAEEVLGKALKRMDDKPLVITKLDPMADLTEDTPVEQVCHRVKGLVERSCKRLGQNTLDVLMLHRWQHRHSHQGIIWKTLLSLQQGGYVQHLGASVQNPQEALEAVQDPDVRYLQLPFNLLDWRWQASGVDAAIRQRNDLTVHARSALLQGTLVSEAPYWPRLEHPPQDYPHRWIQMLQNLSAELERKNVLDLCLAYVRGQDWIDSIVVGVETPVQLDENKTLFQRPPLTHTEIQQVREVLSGDSEHIPEQLLDPAQWKKPC